jgi:hypothetical protein
MSTGYTPVFNSALDGTLYGRWPHTGVWLCILSQCDLHGRIDMVPRLLAAKIGVGEDVLLACISDFMEPDPGSRTGDLEGRRLELLDPATRNWGWRVINHGLYRERARKSAYDAARIEDGRNRERMKARKTGKPLDPRGPDATRSQTQTQTQTQTSNSNKAAEAAVSPISTFDLTAERRAVAEARTPPLDAELTHLRFVAFYQGRRIRNPDGAWRKWCATENAKHGTNTVKRPVAKTLAVLEAEEAAREAETNAAHC